MVNLHASFGNQHSREARLLGRTTGGDAPLFRRKAGELQSRIGDSIENFASPDAARERQLIDNRGQIEAFAQPGMLTRTDRVGIAGGLHTDRLLGMTPERRLQEFQIFVERNIPTTVRQSEVHATLFSPVLGEADLEAYKTDEQHNRIATLLRALRTLAGEKLPAEEDPDAFQLAKDIIKETQNTSNAPGRIYNIYAGWLDGNPTIGQTDATDPEFLLKPGSGIPEELRGALQNLINPLEQRNWLGEMFDLYGRMNTDKRLQRAQQTVDYLHLTKSVQERKLMNETNDFMTNFRNADPRLQLVMMGVGGYLVWKALKAKNPLGRWAVYGLFGYYAYDRFVNGNENALGDMSNGLKKVVQFSGGKMNEALRSMGLPSFKRHGDKLNAMGDFLEGQRLPVGPAMTGMATLSSVKLGTIANAFTPFEEGGALGGSLLIDKGDTAETEPSGNLLYKELKKTMESMRLKSDEKEATFQHLEENNLDTGKAIAHVFYLIAASETHNIRTADDIGKELLSTGSYDALSPDLKVRYQRMVVEGRQIAINRYPNKSLMEIVESLNARGKSEKERKEDNATLLDDPRVPARKNEFALLEDLPGNPDAHIKEEILKDDGFLDKDIEEFLRNAEKSELLTSEASAEIKRKFYIVRRSGSPLTEILQAIEKIKYAILVASTKKEQPLSRDDIVQMTGPDELSVTNILNQVGGYLSRFVALPHGFHTVASLADIRSMLSESWFGSAPLASQGTNFEGLKTRVATFEKEMQNLRNVETLAKQTADKLPSTVQNDFGGKDKLIEVLKPIINQSAFATRMDHAEAHLSQRMALALTRNMRLTATPDGFGRRDELGITPREELNLLKEFDVLFRDVIGGTTNGNGMWRNLEDTDMNLRFTLDDLDQDSHYTEEPQRLEMVAYARDLALLYLLRLIGGGIDAELKASAGEKVKKIYDKLLKQLKADLAEKVITKEGEREKTPEEKTSIMNNESYKCLNKDLLIILMLFGTTVEGTKDIPEGRKEPPEGKSDKPAEGTGAAAKEGTDKKPEGPKAPIGEGTSASPKEGPSASV